MVACLELGLMVALLQVVMEMQMIGMGFNKARPVLTLLVDDVVSFYEMFSYDSGINGIANALHAWLFHLADAVCLSGHLAVRFRRLKCCVVTRGSRFMGQYGRNPVEAARETDRYRPLLCSFEVKVDPLVGFLGAYSLFNAITYCCLVERSCHMRSLPIGDVHRAWRASTPSHDDRRAHHLLHCLQQCQLCQRVPISQEGSADAYLSVAGNETSFSVPYCDSPS